MRPDDVVRERQAQTGAGDTLVVRHGGTIELFEDALLVVETDPHPVITNLDHRLTVPSAQA